MNNLPTYVGLTFYLAVILTLVFLYKASGASLKFLVVLILWVLIQSVIGQSEFYLKEDTLPPRFMLLVLPPFLSIILLFATRAGRRFVDSLDPSILTLMHIVRVPVEFVLLWLFFNKAVPQVMTFEGRNFDMLSGLTAPLVWHFGYNRNKLGKGFLIAWNVICLLLVLNVVIHGILSVPTVFQQISLGQPNIGVLYFPYILLPGLVVPAVIFAHFVCLRDQLRK
jgi:hypothetical protein